MEVVLSLKDACFYFIVENVIELSSAHLSLLPRRVRNRLLPFLPAVDLWRLESCPAFTEGIDMEEVWKGRVTTHINAWEPGEVPQPFEQEKTARETYLYYISHVLLSFGKQSLQTESPYHSYLHTLEGPTLDHTIYKRRYDERVQKPFRLKSSGLKSGNKTQESVEKGEYVDFLFYGIHMKEVPNLLNFTVCSFDSQKEYYVPHHYGSQDNKKYPCLAQFVTTDWGQDDTRITCFGASAASLPWFKAMIAFLMQCSGWKPKKLRVSSPSEEFVMGTSNKCLLNFLSSVEEISVPGFTDTGIPELVNVLTALVGVESGLAPASIDIQTKYCYQLSWLLPKLSTAYSSLPGRRGYSGLRRITIGTSEPQQEEDYTSTPDWSGLFFQEEIESVKLVKLKNSVQLSLLYALRVVVVTRPSLMLVELVDCTFSDEDMSHLVTDFLSTTTAHSQSLLVRQWHSSTRRETAKIKRHDVPPEVMSAVSQLPKPSGSCPSRDKKTLCVPFAVYRSCSWLWELSCQLPSLELTFGGIYCERDLNELLRVLSTTQHPIADGSITVTIEANDPSTMEQSCASIICDLAMCSGINEVRIVQV